MNRFELKFFLDFADYYTFRERLGFYASRDPHALADGRYPVFSLYYDTDNLKFFYDKINGEYEHVKLRLRKYARTFEADVPVFLEAKIKHNQAQKKLRLLRPSDREVRNPADWMALDHPEAEYFAEMATKYRLAPACCVYYEREPFSIDTPAGRIRLNFDTNIAGLYARETRPDSELLEKRSLLEPGQVLLEIKGNSPELPELLRRELEPLETCRTTFSKYATTLAELDRQYDHSEVVL